VGKDLLTISVDSKLYPVPQFELLIDAEPAPTPDNPDARKLVSVSLASEDVSAAIPKSAKTDKVEAEPDKRQKIVDYLAEHPKATVQEIADSVTCSYEYARRMRKDIIREAEDGRVFGTGGGTIQ